MFAGQVWVFGGIIRGEPDICFMEAVEEKDRAILLEIIGRKLKTGPL